MTENLAGRLAKAKSGQPSAGAQSTAVQSDLTPPIATAISPAELAVASAAPTPPEAPIVVEVVKAQEYHQFFSSLRAFSIIMPNGTKLRFTAYRHLTTNKDVIEFLTAEAERTASRIFIKPDEATIEADEIDPNAALLKAERMRVYKELGVVVRFKDSSYQQQSLGATNSKDLKQVAGGSLSQNQPQT